MKKILQLVLVFSEIFIQSSCLLIRQYHYISNPLNWTEAQTYCRQNYIDLATIESSEEMDKFLKAIERPTELESTVKTNSRYGDFWIGLNNEINWKWSDGFSGGITADNYWTSEDQYHSRTDQICLTTSKTNRLSDFDCDSLLTFICYDETLQNTPKYIFVNETMNWSSAQRFCRQNFTDLVTVENEQVWFQKELTDKGVSGVKLKWTEQRDGNVFQKEESKTNLRSNCKHSCSM
ncbi:hypothetical protein OJAV_G00234880 [Oryzias javanicus]|uniref:C-type lectin domain-containing protein n=1 Tax=Oryzias javanicus TaxID=123683 RepID=A0A437BYM5_ORYJA|nr:hypothetical protein OJAV_G00234880 [Oryzias javanicus]